MGYGNSFHEIGSGLGCQKLVRANPSLGLIIRVPCSFHASSVVNGLQPASLGCNSHEKTNLEQSYLQGLTRNVSYAILLAVVQPKP